MRFFWNRAPYFIPNTSIKRYAGHPEEMKAIVLDSCNLRALRHPYHVEAHKLLSSQSIQQAKERTHIEVEAFAATFLR